MAMRPAEEFDPDRPVIEAVRAGDRHAFNELVRGQGSWVRGVIFSVLGDAGQVDDVAQQAWAAVWQRIGELRDVSRWRPWLYRLVRNAAIDLGRETTRRRQHARTLADIPLRPMQPAAADEELARKEQRSRVLMAIEALPVLYREPFVLRHVSGWSYQQIAETMGMPVDSVETRLVRARRFLRESLKGTLG